MIWKLITFFVRKLDPEIAHKLTLKSLKLGLHPRLNQNIISIKIGDLFFKNLTLAPIDTSLINFKLLSSQEKKYLINYHFEVYSKIHKFLSLKEKKWLLKSI